MYSTTKSRWSQVLVWLFWFLALLALACSGCLTLANPEAAAPHPLPDQTPLLAAVATHDHPRSPLFPWWPQGRWRKRTLGFRHAWRVARHLYHRTVWAARLARLALHGAFTMAALVDWLTRAQLRRHLGALPVLYALLEILQVRQIINRYCPTAAEVDHGAVALVLILNRLTAPRPLYKVADWLAQTVLVHTLGLPAAKFNDDRLGRTLDAIAAHPREIWLDIVNQALVRFHIDVRFLFYDLTAFVMQGAYADSQLADYGFAHNTPSDKQKVKTGMTATGDGFIPLEYAALSGRTADVATVQENLERLCRLLERHGWPIGEVLIIGDRANLNDELAVVYDAMELKYLAGLQPQKTVHRELVAAPAEEQFYSHPLTETRGGQGYFGLPCQVTFEHQGKTVTHQGLVVLSGPMRSSLRQGRAKALRTLRAELAEVRAKIGQKRYRSVKDVQARANTCLRRSPVGHLMCAEAYQREDGAVDLRWWVDRAALQQAMRTDGRYLLVTNDRTLTPARMLALYRAKDGLEKRFEVTKQDLRVRPLYVHSDERIEALLLINMLALLVYSVLERQVRRKGLALTTRRLIEQLENLSLIETHCWDGSVVYRLTPVNAEQAELLRILSEIIGEIVVPRLPASWGGVWAPPRGGSLSPPLERLALTGPVLRGEVGTV
jgi:transposase